MVDVHLLYDLDLRPGNLFSRFVHMVDHVVVDDKTNAL